VKQFNTKKQFANEKSKAKATRKIQLVCNKVTMNGIIGYYQITHVRTCALLAVRSAVTQCGRQVSTNH